MLAKHSDSASRSEIEKLLKTHYNSSSLKLLGFYNSVFNRIIKDEDLMVMPVFDRQFYLSHAIFDTMYCENCTIPLLERIILRIKRSCELAGIPLPMPLDLIKLKISHLASYCISQYNLHSSKFFIRLWISSGISPFTLLPEKNSNSILYIVAFSNPNGFDLQKVYKEASIPSRTIKEGALVNSKTSNYLINSLISMEANKKGALNGVMLDRWGYITECPIANVGFVCKKTKVFLIPKWEKVLKGSTLSECLSFIEKKLIPEGMISKVEEKDFKPLDVYDNVEEMLVFGGGKVIAIGEFDNHYIRNDLGPVCIALQNYLEGEYRKTAFKVDPKLYDKNKEFSKL